MLPLTRQFKEVMIDTPEGKFIVPQGTGQGDPLLLDIAGIVRAEVRLQEVAFVNTHTAPELLSVFNSNWLELNKTVTMLTYHKSTAENMVKTVSAQALLDCNDEAIKKKGHSRVSDPLRQAFVELDPEVVAAKERLNQIKTVLGYLTGKMQAFENAYTSVKKIVGSSQLPLQTPHGMRQDEPRPLRPFGVVGSITGPFPKSEDVEDDFIPGFTEPKY